jgi:hypothetical protein
MYKNFSLTDQERKQILEQHQGKGYKQPLKESTLENAVDEIGLTPDEIDALTSSLIDMGKSDFKVKVADIASGESSDDMSSEMMEGGDMSEKEFKLRSAIDKIINKAGVISTLGIVPAAMFAGGGAGVAAGVTALTMLLLKDAAWWKKGHEMHKEMGDARKGTENMGVGDYLMGKESEMDENLGMLARIAAPMAASYVGSKMADTNEDFIDSVKSGYNAVKSGVSNVVGGVQKGMNTLASGMANTLTSDADLKKFNDRILAIANVIKYAKKGTDPKTQQPAWIINNPQSKVNGMRLDEYFKTYRVSVGEVEAAKMVNQQGGKPLSATQKLNTSGNQYMRSFAAHPPTFAKLFNEQSSFIDSVKSGLADVGRAGIDGYNAYRNAGRNVVAAAKSGLAAAKSGIEDVGAMGYNTLNKRTVETGLVACSALGVKFPGLCHKVTKKPVLECVKLGVKTVGYCFVDTKQPVNASTPKQQPLSELGGYIGDAPEKIDGPFMKEIDPSVYEDISYLDAMKADILLMRLFHNDIISKDAFLEVRKPVDEIVKILKGGYFEKEKDLPF